VSQDWSIFCPKFSVKNSSGDSVLRIEGPFCTYSICGDVEFEVLSLDKSTKVTIDNLFYFILNLFLLSGWKNFQTVDRTGSGKQLTLW